MSGLLDKMTLVMQATTGARVDIPDELEVVCQGQVFPNLSPDPFRCQHCRIDDSNRTCDMGYHPLQTAGLLDLYSRDTALWLIEDLKRRLNGRH